MSKKLMTLLLTVLLCLVQATNAGTIIWVDEGAVDGFSDWQVLLEGAGHTVTRSDMKDLDDTKIAAMNEADLVIVSRDTNSGDYNNGDEPTQWNSLTVPLIQCSSWLIRSSRWKWVSNTGCPSIGPGDSMVIAVDHPIFRGVASAGNEISMLTETASLTDATDGGNGLVLGTHSDGRLWITYWEAGTEFYSGAGQVPAAPRMWFATGNNNGDVAGGSLLGAMNLTEDGQSIFLNAVSFLMGETFGVASAPSPADATTDVLRDTVLSWTPSDSSVTRNMYFGVSFEDVNTATVATASNMDANSFDPGRLDFGKTYFWRVDEVNGAPDNTIFKGNVWSFEVEPYSIQIAGSEIIATASSWSNDSSMPEKTLDGSGLEEDNTHGIATETMWFTEMGDMAPWIQYEFDEVKKLDTMKVWNSNSSAEGFIGYGIKQVKLEYSKDGETWDVLEDVNELSRAVGSATYNQYDEVDMGGVAAKMVRLNIQSNWGGFMQSYSLSEVQFNAIPAAARTPDPASGSTDILPNAVLLWRAGREAAQSIVYLSTDPNEVAAGTAPSATANTNSINLSDFDIQLGQTYYWRVDEVNNAEAVSVWAGPVWSFSTVAVMVVDDFESYGNESPDRPFQVWLDGFGYSADEFFPAGYGGNGTGSGVGHDIWSVASPHYNGSIMETTIVKSGQQSMPLYYNNGSTTAVAETSRSFAVPQNWTQYGVKGLTFQFFGDAANTTTQMYVEINGTRVAYQSDFANLQQKIWQTWYVDLSDLIGVNLSSVTELTIGFQGGIGVVYFDDIVLSPLDRQLVTPVQPDASGLIAHYAFDGDTLDSTGNNPGTVEGAPTYVLGKNGQAIKLNGTSDYVLVEGSYLLQNYTISMWFRADDVTGSADLLSLVNADGGHGILMELRADGSIRYLHRFPFGTSGGSNVYSAPGFDDGTWYHLTVVKTDATIAMYINGAEAGSAADDTLFETVPSFTMGVLKPDDLIRYLPGELDDVYVYDRALSLGEVAGLAGRTEPFDQ